MALRSLASSTLHTLLPKLETRGQLGAARWRLVGAPALPNLLGVLDAAATPSLSSSSSDTLDPARLLSRLAVGESCKTSSRVVSSTPVNRTVVADCD